MHTIDALDTTDFKYVSNGRTVPKHEVLPPIAIPDRLGIVMGHGAEGLGAGTFILASVIDFYAALSDQKTEFFEYPDFYTFQATTDPADYRMFDIYPDHKNVGIEGDAESVLQAVNDRAIDILLVPNRPPSTTQIEAITRRSAERRLDACYLYAPRGRLDDPDFRIEAPREPLERWFETTAESTTDPAAEKELRARQANHRISQPFRQVSIERALEYLPEIDHA